MNQSLEIALSTPAPWIMGILNLTPDSFSDGGRINSLAQAVELATRLSKDGAQIIDLGGESTGPGRSAIDEKEEISRISETLKAISPHTFVSIDTYKSKTARYCLEHGARMINDVSSLRADKEMAAVVKDFDCFLVMMFSKENGKHPHATSTPRKYDNLIQEIADFLNERLDYALSQGIPSDKIILDPGMGTFLSSLAEYSWSLLEKFAELRLLFPDFPFLLGTSRKGFLGLELAERDPLSQLTGLIAQLKGASIIRTHNPQMMKSFGETWRRLM